MDLDVKTGFHRHFSLTIICHRNFGNEFAFTHSKDYLYYLACSPLSHVFDNDTSPQNLVYKSIFFCDKPTLSKNNVCGSQALIIKIQRVVANI